MSEMVFKRSIDYILRKTNDVLASVSEDDIKGLCELFLHSKRVFVYGAGRSGLAAKAFGIRLVHLGFQTFVVGETITPPVRKGDLVVIVSASGETIPCVMTAEIAKGLGAKVIAVVGDETSALAKLSDLFLVLSAKCDDVERAVLAPLGTLFEAAAWVLLDGIVAELMAIKGESEERMKKRHATLQ
ncbi:MAG: SIS domain-containing protein [Thermoplasmata archaeon]|nr:MAG: SIS domain-containing protein [Thermoplasmata archaeon]MCD6468334.1 SIS domain-containing protein [Thermoplasmata archaeon]RLF23614.1 MAG: 6-phospho-3-hexuloisomerase [Thermoplasmata archaeon]